MYFTTRRPFHPKTNYFIIIIIIISIIIILIIIIIIIIGIRPLGRSG
jgi:hypothetical protein